MSDCRSEAAAPRAIAVGGHDRLVHVERVWGTVVSLHAVGGNHDDRRQAVATMAGWLHHVDRTLSTFRADSDLSRYRRGELAPAEHSNLAEVLALAEGAHSATAGAFDPHWRGGRADPTGLVKGWAAQRCAQFGMRYGLAGLQVNAGGDVCTRGVRADGQSWRIGIEDPHHPDDLLDVVEGNNLHVATSGLSRRGHHIAGTTSTHQITQASVIGTDLAAADAYATALIATNDPHGLAQHLDCRGWSSLLVDSRGRRSPSAHWIRHIAREGATA